MDRLIRLHRLWTWLPAFRVVAETEHLHEAASRVHLTPSTLSRAIHLLEEDVGRTLFHRSGRGIKLTEHGRMFASALRDAMRRLDDALVAIGSEHGTSVRVACGDQLATLAVVPALATLTARYPAAKAVLTPLDEPPASLRSGTIDVAFAMAAGEYDELVVERVGELRHAIYGAPGARSEYIHADELPWPAEQPREIAVRVPSATLAIAACRAGLGVAMLPERAAVGLDRVGNLPYITVPIYAIRRDGPCPAPVVTLIDGVRAALA